MIRTAAALAVQDQEVKVLLAGLRYEAGLCKQQIEHRLGVANQCMDDLVERPKLSLRYRVYLCTGGQRASSTLGGSMGWDLIPGQLS